MPVDRYETRTATRLRTGSKIALLCGIPFLVLAAYFYLVPLNVDSANGVFGCGTAADPPTDGWAKGICQGVPKASLYRAIVCLALGVLIPLIGAALFGVDKHEEQRRVRDDDDDDYDDRWRGGRSASSERFVDADEDEDTPRSSRRRYKDDDVVDEAPARKPRRSFVEYDDRSRRGSARRSSGRRRYEEDDESDVDGAREAARSSDDL